MRPAGPTNLFLVATADEREALANDVRIMETNQCSKAFRLLRTASAGILHSLPPSERQTVRQKALRLGASRRLPVGVLKRIVCLCLCLWVCVCAQ